MWMKEEEMNTIKTILREQYDLNITEVLPQQGGWAALAYKVYNDDHTYFLKVYEKTRASTAELTSRIVDYVPVTQWLASNTGLKGKIPVPLLTSNGSYKHEDDEGVYLLYEHIEGETIGPKDLTERQVVQLAEIIGELHLYGDNIPMDTSKVKENFEVPFLRSLSSIIDEQFARLPADLKERLRPFQEPIRREIAVISQLSVKLQESEPKMALCHTDLHHWNLMQSGEQLILIDWEGLKLAPVEADLMFLDEKIYFDPFLRVYRNCHNHFESNPDALRFYKGRRLLEDIWQFIEQLLYENQSEDDRSVTLNWLSKELNTLNEVC